MTPPPWAGLWTWDTVTGEAGELHARSAARLEDRAAPGRGAWVLEAKSPALVLGSAEEASHIDAAAAAAAGIDVARRRSGGGAVLVGPGRCLWVDLVIGRGDPLWHDDVGRGAWWVGQLWVAALAARGLGGAVEWRGALRRSEWSDRACFGGLGPGEVTVGGGKVVGISQRRTRAGALFQCAVLLASAPAQEQQGLVDGLAELVAVQALDVEGRTKMLDALRRCTFPLPVGDAPGLVEALRSQLGVN